MTAPAPVPVPATLTELLSPAWLTSALAARFGGTNITSVTPGPVISRVSTNARFRIECAGGIPDGLSPDLCGKGYFTETGWAYRHAGEAEARFYRDVADRTGLRTLRSVYADVDPATGHGVIITEDVVVQGATFLDARSEYTPDQAADGVVLLGHAQAGNADQGRNDEHAGDDHPLALVEHAQVVAQGGLVRGDGDCIKAHAGAARIGRKTGAHFPEDVAA